MCGRYGIFPASDISNRFGTSNSLDFVDRYNIAPGQIAPVITNRNQVEITPMKWGLIPSWAKDPQIGLRMINARSESLLDKPSFRNSFKYRRCLIPASGFYEWKQKDKLKKPYFIRPANHKIFAFGGLYDAWVNPAGNQVNSYTIISTTPNDILKPIHNRMPVILQEQDEKIWLNSNSNQSDLLNLLKPYSGDLETYEVSPAVNRAAYDDQSLIDPIEN